MTPAWSHLDPARPCVVGHPLTCPRLQCAPCMPGQRCDGAGAATCAAGFYSDVVGGTACTPCAAGEFAAARGSAACLPCPAGTYAAAPGQAECTPCPEGTVSDVVGAATACLPTLAETYAAAVAGSDGSAGVTCQPGTFRDEQGQAACKVS